MSVQGGEGGGRGGNVHLLGGDTPGNGKPGGNVKVESGGNLGATSKSNPAAVPVDQEKL